MNKNKGVAFPIVLAIITFVAVAGGMFHALIKQRSHEVTMSYEQARAELAVRAGVDLAFLKIQSELNPKNPDLNPTDTYLDENSPYFLCRFPRQLKSGNNLDNTSGIGPMEYQPQELDLEDFLEDPEESLQVTISASLTDLKRFSRPNSHVNPDIYSSTPRMGNSLRNFLSGSMNSPVYFDRPDLSFVNFKTSWWGYTVDIAKNPSRLKLLLGLKNWLESGAWGGYRPPTESMEYYRQIRFPQVRDYYPASFDLENSHNSANLPDYIMEKSGTIVIKGHCSFTSRRNTAIKVSRYAIAERGFKTVDCQAIAPAYSLFVNNSGDEIINFNSGITPLYQVFVNSFPLNYMKNYFNKSYGTGFKENAPFPGSIRINGTRPMEVNIPGRGRGSYGDQGNNWVLSCAFQSQAPQIERANYYFFTGPFGGTLDLLFMSRFKSADEHALQHSHIIGWLDWIGMNNIMKNSWPMPYVRGINRFSMGIGGGAMVKTVNYCRTSKLSDPNFAIMDIDFLPNQTATHLFGFGGISAPVGREVEGLVYKRDTSWVFGFSTHFRTKWWIKWMGLPHGELPWWSWAAPILLPMWWSAEFEHSGYLDSYAIDRKYGYPGAYGSDINNRWIAKNSEPPMAFDPKQPLSAPRNLYHQQEYLAKGARYYANASQFWQDYPNRIDKDGNFVLDGFSYIDGDFQLDSSHVPGVFRIIGQGGFLIAGDIDISCDIRQSENPLNGENTLFSIIQVPLIAKGSDPHYFTVVHGSNRVIEAALGVQRLYLTPGTNLKIVGNLVVDDFNREYGWDGTNSTLVIDYTPHNTTASQAALRLVEGKYDPRRYHVSLSPAWTRFRIQENHP